MGLQAAIAVGGGAAIGAWLRWWLGATLNSVFPTLPLGTLAANLVGGYLIGVAVEFFLHHSSFPGELRLFVITGVLGGLTTFSTFSAEAVHLLTRTQYAWALAHVAFHLLGSLGMTVLGIITMRWIQG